VNSATNAVDKQVGGMLGGFLGHKPGAAAPASTAARGIPITITGTAQSPSIHANIGAMLR
jgi:hypothetical protein